MPSSATVRPIRQRRLLRLELMARRKQRPCVTAPGEPTPGDRITPASANAGDRGAGARHVHFVINLLLARPLLDSLLFSLAIAVGITPQLLPAVVSTSLATGSRRLARRKVLVKRPGGASNGFLPPSAAWS
jgi:hypothetical protein